MYIRVMSAQAFNEPEVLIKNPSIWHGRANENGKCMVFIENEYLQIITAQDKDYIIDIMNQVVKMKYDQNCGSPQNDVLFEAIGRVKVLSKASLLGEIISQLDDIAYHIDEKELS